MGNPDHPSEAELYNERDPLVIAYTAIVHKHGFNSTEANGFRAMHQEDAVFQRRAKVLDMSAQAKDAM